MATSSARTCSGHNGQQVETNTSRRLNENVNTSDLAQSPTNSSSLLSSSSSNRSSRRVSPNSSSNASSSIIENISYISKTSNRSTDQSTSNQRTDRHKTTNKNNNNNNNRTGTDYDYCQEFNNRKNSSLRESTNNRRDVINDDHHGQRSSPMKRSKNSSHDHHHHHHHTNRSSGDKFTEKQQQQQRRESPSSKRTECTTTNTANNMAINSDDANKIKKSGLHFYSPKTRRRLQEEKEEYNSNNNNNIKNKLKASVSLCNEKTDHTNNSNSKKSFASTPKSERRFNVAQSRIKDLKNTEKVQRNLSTSWADIIEELDQQSKDLDEYVEKMTRKFSLNKEKFLKSIEQDTELLRKRQKQINYGKLTGEYERYVMQVPKEKRKQWYPKTPSKYIKCSRRKFDGKIRQWRKMLHVWDENPEKLKDFKNSFDKEENGGSGIAGAGDITDEFGGTSNIDQASILYNVDDYDIIDYDVEEEQQEDFVMNENQK